MQERVIRYESASGTTTVETYIWQRWRGSLEQRTRDSGCDAAEFRNYFHDEREKFRNFVMSMYQAKRNAKDIRREERLADRDELKERSDIIADLGSELLRLTGNPSRRRDYAPQTVNIKTNNTIQQVEATNENMNKINNNDDIDDEDWNTTQWNRSEIESSLDFLVREIRNSPNRKRRRIATQLLCTLLKKHDIAMDRFDLSIAVLVNTAFGASQGSAKVNMEAARLRPMLADVSRYMSDALSRNGTANLASKLLAYKYHIASRLIQAHYRSFVYENFKSLDLTEEEKFNSRSMYSSVIKDTSAKWRQFSRAEEKGLDEGDIEALLTILTGLCHTESPSSYIGKDRKKVFGNGCLYPILQFCVDEAPRLRSAALQLLRQLAEDDDLVPSMVQAGIHITLGKLLESELLEDRVMSLDILNRVCDCICAFPPAILDELWDLRFCPAMPSCESDPYRVIPKEEVMKTSCSLSTSLLLHRRRDGGLLRCIFALLDTMDDVVRLGACMCLLKLASSPGSPLLVGFGETVMLQEKYDLSVYERRRGEDIRAFMHALLYNISSTDSPGLSVAALQVLAQLIASKDIRMTLTEFGLAEQVLHHFCTSVKRGHIKETNEKGWRNRGLLILAMLSCNLAVPLPISPTWELESNLNEYHAEHILRPILKLDMFCGEIAVFECVQETIMALMLQSELESNLAIQKLLGPFRGLPVLLRFLLDAPQNPRRVEDHIRVVSLVMDKLWLYAPDHAQQCFSIPLIKRLLSMVAVLTNVPNLELNQIAFIAACNALKMFAKQTEALKPIIIQQFLEESTAEPLVDLVAYASANCMTTCGVAAAELLGEVIPRENCEQENYSDTMFLLNAATDEKLSQNGEVENSVAVAARLQAHNAFEYGIANNADEEDFNSEFKDPAMVVLVLKFIQQIHCKLVRTLKVSRQDISLCNSICLALARINRTRSIATDAFKMDIFLVLEPMIPSELPAPCGMCMNSASCGPCIYHPKLMNSDDLVQIPQRSFRDSIFQLPVSFFALCANTARTNEGKLRIIDGGILALASRCIHFLLPDDAQSRLILRDACTILTRCANIHHPVSGESNQMMFRSQASGAFVDRVLTLCGSHDPQLQFCASMLLGQLSRDEFRILPLLLENQRMDKIHSSIEQLVVASSSILRNASIRQLLRMLARIHGPMMGMFVDDIARLEIDKVLAKAAAIQEGPEVSEKVTKRRVPGIAVLAFSILDNFSQCKAALREIEAARELQQKMTLPPPETSPDPEPGTQEHEIANNTSRSSDVPTLPPVSNVVEDRSFIHTKPAGKKPPSKSRQQKIALDYLRSTKPPPKK